MADATSPYVDVWKDLTIEFYVETDDANGNPIPAAGLTGLIGRLGQTEQGAAIGTLTGALTERPGRPGYYYRVVDLATLTSQLPANTYPHRSPIYTQLERPGDVEVEGFRKVLRRSKT